MARSNRGSPKGTKVRQIQFCLQEATWRTDTKLGYCCRHCCASSTEDHQCDDMLLVQYTA
eukprot:1042469-Amphidinium_carterae.1